MFNLKQIFCPKCDKISWFQALNDTLELETSPCIEKIEMNVNSDFSNFTHFWKAKKNLQIFFRET